MKKLFTILVALFIAQLTFSQTFINENFSGSTWPPAGWGFDGLPNQWSRSATENAGGSAPEAKFTYIQQNTTSRIVSPAIDLTGVNDVALTFKYFYDWYANGVSIGVATRFGTGAWEIAWQVSPTGNQGPKSQSVELTNVGQADFQFCLFISGNLYNVDYWYIDDVKLFVRENLDAGLQSVDVPTYFIDEQDVTGKVINEGINNITSFDINWKLDENAVQTTSFTGLNIATDATYTYTSDQTLVADPGLHTLQVWVSNVNGTTDDNPENDTITKTIGIPTQTLQRKPLFEEFTSSTCAPCASFNNGVFNPFIDQHGEEIALIKYQMNWPGSGDPYYTAEGGVRRTFYGVSYVPDLMVEGARTATNSGGVNTAFNNGMADPAFVVINGMHLIDGTNITVEANILPYVDLLDVTVQIAVIEKVTTENVATNGETSFHHVMMKMLPDADGTTLNMTAGETTTLTYSHDMIDTNVEEMDDLMVVIFVQDNSNKKVFQSEYSVESEGFPASLSFDPLPGTTGVETFADLTITFSEPVNMVGGGEITNENVASLISLTETDSMEDFPFVATIDENKSTITITHEGLFDSYTWYTLTCAPVENAAGIASTEQGTYFETGMHVGLSENKLEGIVALMPNPASESTFIRFKMEEAGYANLTVYDVKGQVVVQLLDEKRTQGLQSIRWIPSDELSNGLYFISLRTSKSVYTSKLMLNR